MDVGFSRKRVGRNGRVRYTAYYKDVKGRERSAGTFPNIRDADRAWQRAETKLAEGRVGDPARGRMTFARYVEESWLPHHQMEASTRQRYTYSLRKHIIPEFGPMRMVDILPEHVRAWITRLQADGVSAGTINANKSILSAVFTTALNDQVTFVHPCKGVKTPPVAVQPRTIITPEQFDTLYWELPEERMRLLVETAIESGTRWGELSELRVRDLDVRSGIVTVSRAVVEVNPKFHPTGGRFLVKDYPKDREYRRFKLSTQLVRKLDTHIRTHTLVSGDLLFPAVERSTPKARIPAVPDPATLGLTDPNAYGRQYRHGTLSGYSAGKCRCEHCKGAYARYRAERRAKGKDDPREPRLRETDGHVSADWFRRQVWKPALSRAALGVQVRFHDLRHAHASWLLAGGADLQVVKERLGHSDIATTARYLHTLPDADETALSALASVRGRSGRRV
jgi:integrase